MRNQFKLKQGAWTWDRHWSIKFPEHWIIEVFTHKDVEQLDESKIGEKIKAPIGTDPLEQMVKPGSSVLIICDDLSRPTRTDQILPILIALLEDNGIESKSISLLISSGTHSPMKEDEIMLKIGKQVTEGYAVHIHDYRRKGVLMGRTTQGTPVYVNRQIVKHDLIIGLGGIYPHSTAGFSGGAKLILGVCNIRTILHFHMTRSGAATGGKTDNDFRRDVLDAARIAGMNFIVNSMINKEREITEVVSGDVEKAYNHGVAMARNIYGIPKPDAEKFDLVIADTYPFDATYAFTRKGWWPVRNIAQDCHKLIISSMHEGKGGHLIYPIPYDRKINKLIRLYYELITFGLAQFISTSVVDRLKKISSRLEVRKIKVKRDPSPLAHSKPMESGFPGGDVDILHHATGKAKKSLEKLPNRLFDKPETYIRHMVDRTGNKPVRVALYQASSLTFPNPESSGSE